MIAFCICRHEQIPQMLRRETIMWKHLKHPKISPLLVVSVSQLRVIFGWVSSGELLDYIKKTLAQAYLHLCVSLLLQLSHTYSTTSSPRSQRASTTSTRVMRLKEILWEYLVLLDYISPLRWQLVGMACLCTLLTTVPPLKHRWLLC